MHAYLLFHSLAEIASATVSIGTFLFTWNTRRFQNTYLLVIGIAALFVGLFEILHCLAFPGMGVFVGFDDNLSPQLWLCARIFQAVAAVGGLLLLNRTLNVGKLVWFLALAFTTLCTVVFLREFPDTVAKPQGLTPFKVTLEWCLVGLFLTCAGLLYRERERVAPVFRLLFAQALVMAGCEVCFTLYVGPYDPANFIGHVLLLIAGALQYQAILRTGLVRPAEALFFDLSQARERLEQVDRQKNEFISVLSHELRNPLAPIKNSLIILDRAGGLNDRGRLAAGVIERQVNQLARLIDDLLDLTRISKGKIRLQEASIDLRDVVLRTLEDLSTVLEEHAVSTTIPPGPVPVYGDTTRLSQVLANLLGNAAKFTPLGGRIDIRLGAEHGKAQLEVEDTGAGIEPQMLSRLFTPFAQAEHTLDRSRGGLGLGLALAKGLVELQRGRVSAHSEGLGRGTLFRVELPLDEHTDSTVTGGTLVPAAPANPAIRRVLVIEDNVDALETLRDVLELEGHLVETATDGPGGLTVASTFDPEVVLCDIGLPGMDGYAVAQALRRGPKGEGLYLVALTGYAQPDDVARAHGAGFNAHLAKPPDLEALAKIVGAPGIAS